METELCPRCANDLVRVDYCEDGEALVCIRCAYATSPSEECRRRIAASPPTLAEILEWVRRTVVYRVPEAPAPSS